jgi:hypothetical protein
MRFLFYCAFTIGFSELFQPILAGNLEVPRTVKEQFEPIKAEYVRFVKNHPSYLRTRELAKKLASAIPKEQANTILPLQKAMYPYVQETEKLWARYRETADSAEAEDLEKQLSERTAFTAETYQSFAEIYERLWRAAGVDILSGGFNPSPFKFENKKLHREITLPLSHVGFQITYDRQKFYLALYDNGQFHFYPGTFDRVDDNFEIDTKGQIEFIGYHGSLKGNFSATAYLDGVDSMEISLVLNGSGMGLEGTFDAFLLDQYHEHIGTFRELDCKNKIGKLPQ